MKPRVVIVITEGGSGAIEFSVESEAEIDLHIFDFSDPDTRPLYHVQTPKTKTYKQLTTYIKRWTKLGKFSGETHE